MNEQLAQETALKLLDAADADLVGTVVEQYAQRLDVLGDHGPLHWERALINGLLLSQTNPIVDKELVFYFSLFHDSKRENENEDPLHGPRGAEYGEELIRMLPKSTQRKIHIFEQACGNHTAMLYSSEPTVAACFDADRLDLNRVRIYPNKNLMNMREVLSDSFIFQRSQVAKAPYPIELFSKGYRK